MLEDFRLRVFLAVAQEGSFTLASKKLHVSQPAVSQNIAELEKTLGVTLFERLRGEVRLTDKGLLFKGYAEQILHWYGAAADAFAISTDVINSIYSSSGITRLIYNKLTIIIIHLSEQYNEFLLSIQDF